MDGATHVSRKDREALDRWRPININPTLSDQELFDILSDALADAELRKECECD